MGKVGKLCQYPLSTTICCGFSGQFCFSKVGRKWAKWPQNGLFKLFWSFYANLLAFPQEQKWALDTFCPLLKIKMSSKNLSFLYIFWLKKRESLLDSLILSYCTSFKSSTSISSLDIIFVQRISISSSVWMWL